MPQINVSEADFEAVAFACHSAVMKGDDAQARTLDKLARKINLALSVSTARGMSWGGGAGVKRLTWRDMPPVVEGLTNE